MIGAGSFLLGLAALLGGAPIAPAIAPPDFRGWFAAAAEGTLAIPAEVERRARCYRYVFVGGFRNERMPGYFVQNAKELRAHGILRPAIHFLDPSSHRTFEGNVNELGDGFRAIARQGPEKLVVIAHSRGACDTLAFMLRNEEFARDCVEALFLVQGPFGGTGVADYLAGEGPAMDRRMPPGHRLLAHFLGWMEKRLLKRGKHGGLPDLTRQASNAFWERTLKEHAAAIATVGPKTFYVRAETRPAHLRLVQRAAAWYLRTYFGPNDGLVARDDQSLAGLGTVLATLDAGHTDLTNRFPSARARPRLRRALIQSIIMALGSEGTAPGTAPPKTSARGPASARESRSARERSARIHNRERREPGSRSARAAPPGPPAGTAAADELLHRGDRAPQPVGTT
jgi:hypothetical protein